MRTDSQKGLSVSNKTEKDLATELLKEHKRSRRWKNTRFFCWIALATVYSFLLFGNSDEPHHALKSGNYISLLKIAGPIMPDSTNAADNLRQSLHAAFADTRSKGVLLLINSPGGTPVQSAIIHDQIVHLKKKFKKKVVVVAEDSLASGAYLIAVAADKIYVNESTVTGSIGVIMSSFGFTDLMKKVGVTRRTFTAGQYKGRLDPFEPINPVDTNKMQSVLAKIHAQFIAIVKKGRGKRLDLSNPNLFTGDFWVGRDAVKLGLVDGLDNLWGAMKTEFKVSHYRDYSPQHSLIHTLLQGAKEQLPLQVSESTSIQAMLR
jgi:protease IV